MKNRATSASLTLLSGLALAALVSAPGCSSKTNDGNLTDGGPGADDGDGGSGSFGDGVLGDDCPTDSPTTITGTVYDPGGKNPLYNVVVSTPTTAVTPFKATVTCDSCLSQITGNPSAKVITDASGKFTLKGVKSGSKVKIVAQIGKFRKQFTIPNVTACGVTTLDDDNLRLPKNGSEGELPNIAISTGGADTLECLLSRMGIDPSEFVPDQSKKGHIHIYQGNGLGTEAPTTDPPAANSVDALWDSVDHLRAYDMVLLSCEGTETVGMEPNIMLAYANAGGRIFASHFHYTWFSSGPLSDADSSGKSQLATWLPDSQLLNGGDSVDGVIQTGFPKGKAMKTWLGNVGALNAKGNLPIVYACGNAQVTAANTPSTAWIQVDKSSEYLSFNTPFEKDPADQCGRVVYSDLHVGAAAADDPSKPVPKDCAAAELTPQEKALEFMLFDLASCVIPDNVPPSIQ